MLFLLRKLGVIVRELFNKIIDFFRRIFSDKEKTEEKEFKFLQTYYCKKNFLSEFEKMFFNVLLELEKDNSIRIQPQVNLACIVNAVDQRKFHNELFRNIDFAIFNSDYSELLLLIELNDNSHKLASRKKRDEKVKKIVTAAGYKIITFYANYPNEKEYVKNRVLKEVGIVKNSENESNDDKKL
jgi:Protein of unknown function (DUF2726).